MHHRSCAVLVLSLCLTLAGCGQDDLGLSAGQPNLSPAKPEAGSEAFGWPASKPGEGPPESPLPTGDLALQLNGLLASLPRNELATALSPVALGFTVGDLLDPRVVEFQIRAMAAQLSDGSRLDQAFHWYGHPDNNAGVALVPVSFTNRYGTRLYGEIVLPQQGQVAARPGQFPVILALEGLNTNTAMYRWWHQLFADAGYLVFAFDFSGQGRSDDEVAGDPGNNIEEAQDALTYLLEQSPVRSFLNPSQVGVIGHSMGAIATLGLQAVEPRLRAAVAAAPISERSAPFEANPIPVMIQTGDHDGPIAPIVFVNPQIVRPVYDKLTGNRAFIVADAASHAQHTNYPLLPTSTWGREIAAQYSLAWMDFHLRGMSSAKDVLRTAHPRLSYLHASEVVIDGERQVFQSAGPAVPGL